MNGPRTRRQWLATCAAAATVAGCLGDGGGSDEGDGTTDEPPTDDTATTQQTTTEESDAGLALAGPWKMWGFDASNNPGTTEWNGSSDTPRERWTFDLESGVSPAFADGTFYTADEGAYYALDARSGEVRWEASHESQRYFTPVVDDGTLYVVDGGRLTAVDAESGEERWGTEVPEVWWYTYRDGTAYIVTYEDFAWNELLAVDVDSRETVWRVPTRSEDDVRITGMAVGADGTLYTTDIDRNVTAFAGESGEELWNYRYESVMGDVAQGVSVADGTAYVTYTTDVDGSVTYQGRVTALDGASGEVEWTSDDANNSSVPPTVVDGTVYVRRENTAKPVTALDAADGTELSGWPANVGYGYGRYRPVVTGDTVYVWQDDSDGGAPTLYAVDADTAETRWTHEASVSGITRPVAVGDVLCYYSDRGLVALAPGV